MILLWCICYTIGVTVTGNMKPWEWTQAYFMVIGMFVSTGIGLIVTINSYSEND